MDVEHHLHDQPGLSASALEDEYLLLLQQHMPSAGRGRFWWQSVSRPPASFPAQGWKLHVSATILNASRVFSRCVPLLLENDVVFKVPAGLEELSDLNAGLEHNFSQVGKFLTVFPRTTELAVQLAGELDRLTGGLTGPLIPFDRRLHSNSLVYYRYGSFHDDIAIEPGQDNQDSINATRDPDREVPVPDGISDPFPRLCQTDPQCEASLPESYHVFGLIRQRGRGGVYRAIQDTAEQVSVCIIKEGRALGEIDYLGRDGLWRLRHERDALGRFREFGLPVPPVIEYFEVGSDGYLVLPQLGRTLFEAIYDDTVSETDRLHLSREVCLLVERIHMHGCVWRDCKADNFIVSDISEHKLTILDLESVRFPEQMSSRSGRSFRTLQAVDIQDCAATIVHVLSRVIVKNDRKYTPIDRSLFTCASLADALNDALTAPSAGTEHLQRIRVAICAALGEQAVA